MKKGLSAILVLCMLLSVVFSMAICSLFKERIYTGLEAAKLLLANERMDESLVGRKVDFGLSNLLKSSLAELPDDPFSLQETQYNSIVPLSSTEDRRSYTWDDFPDYSVSMVEFDQFVKSADKEAVSVAEDIAHMKTSVGITDKWVRVGSELQMLRVYDTYDVLLVLGIYDDIHVYYRYTDENARNVYDMFSFMSYDDGTTGEIRTLLIPGERYEQMYNNSNGFTDYFIAENSRGYWINTRFNYYCDPDTGFKSISFSPYIIRDGLGFGSFLKMDSSSESLENAWYTVFDPTNNLELFRIGLSPGLYSFDLYFTAINNGFVSVSSENASQDVREDVYTTSKIDKLTTQKGVYNASDYYSIDKNTFGFSSGYVQYFYGEEFYFGSLEFAMPSPSISPADACAKFEEYVKEIGLDLHCDMDTVARSLEHAVLLSDNFGDSFSWNGYNMSSIENVDSARDVLDEKFREARYEYEKVNNYEVVSSRQVLSKNAHFSLLNMLVSGNNTLENNLISLSGISVMTNDVHLFEVGAEYVIKVGLSLIDEEGKPISVNTIPLSGTEGSSVRFEGKAITLQASGEYEIPLNLHEGNYAAVVYVATKNEKIRVSEMKKIAFVTIDEGEIESAAMNIEADEEDGNLILDYKIKNERRITVAKTKDGYSYSEIERMINLEILSYGLPYSGAVLEYADGTAVSDESLGAGTYRMMCYLATSDGLAQSYIYLTLE